MKTFEAFEVGKVVPVTLRNELEKIEGERAFCSLGDGGINIFIVINKITKKELKEFAGSVSVIYQEYEVPFLILKYQNMSFDMPLRVSGSLGGNAANIYIIDLKGYILKYMRLLGLNETLFSAIKQGVEFSGAMDQPTMWSIIQNTIYPKYSAADMCKGGIRQRFERIG